MKVNAIPEGVIRTALKRVVDIVGSAVVGVGGEGKCTGVAYPNPKDGSGGGPRSRDYRPNPEDSGGGNPRSVVLRAGAIAVTMATATRLCRTTVEDVESAAEQVRLRPEFS